MFGVNVGALTVHVRANTTQFDQTLTKLQRRVNSWATNFSRIGSRLSIAITAPFVALANASAEAFGEFNKAMVETEAVLGGLSSEMKNAMSSVAKQMSTEMVFSSEELAQAYVTLARAGNNAQQSMERLGVVAKLSQAGVVDLDQTVELLTTAFSSLQESAQMTGSEIGDFTRLANLLLQASIISEGEVTDFALAMTRKVGPALRFTNRDMEEGIALLATYAKMGMRGAFAAERIDILLRDLHAAQIRAKDQWLKYGLATETAEGQVRPLVDILRDLEGVLNGLNPLQRRAMLQQLGFQFRSVQATIAILGMTDVLEDFHRQIKGTGDIIGQVSDKQMDAWVNSMKALRNEVLLAAQDIGQALAPAITLTAKAVAMAANFFRMLPGPIQTAVVVLGAMIAIIGPLLLIMGQMITVGVAMTVVLWKLNKRWNIYMRIIGPGRQTVMAMTSALISMTRAMWASTAPLPVAVSSWMQLWKTWGKSQMYFPGANLAALAKHIASLHAAIAMFNFRSKVSVRILTLIINLFRNFGAVLVGLSPKILTIAMGLLRLIPVVRTILLVWAAFKLLKGIVELLSPMVRVFAHYTGVILVDAFEWLKETTAATVDELVEMFPILSKLGDFFVAIGEKAVGAWNEMKASLKGIKDWFADWELMLPRADISQPINTENMQPGQSGQKQVELIDEEMLNHLQDARRAFELANPALNDFQREMMKINHQVEDFEAKGVPDSAIQEWREFTEKTLRADFASKAAEEFARLRQSAVQTMMSLDDQLAMAVPGLNQMEDAMRQIDIQEKNTLRELAQFPDLTQAAIAKFEELRNLTAQGIFNNMQEDITQTIQGVNRQLQLLQVDDSQNLGTPLRDALENSFAVEDMIAAIEAAGLSVDMFQAQIDEYRDTLNRLSSEKAFAEMKQQAESALEAIRTPEEAFKDSESLFTTWLEAGVITMEQFNKLMTAESEKLKESMEKNLDLKDAVKMPDALEAGSNAAFQRMQDFAMQFRKNIEGTDINKKVEQASKTQELIQKRREMFGKGGGLGFKNDPLETMKGAANAMSRMTGQTYAGKALEGFNRVKSGMTGINPHAAGAAKVRAAMDARPPIDRKPLPPGMQQFKEEKDKEEQLPITDRLDIIAEILRQNGGGAAF